MLAPGRGVVEPRALRRRALRPARSRATATSSRCTRARATTASAPRSSAASCSAPTRCPAATTTPTTAARSRCARRSPTTSAPRSSDFDFVVTPTAPTVAFELGAKTADPLAMYLNDFCTVPMSLAGIPAISIPSGLERRPAGRLPARRPGVQREPRSSTRRYALERAIGFDAAARGARMTRLRARHRPGDPRPARDADEDVLRLRAVASASRRTRTPARSASACPARCRWPTARRSTSG